MGSVRAEALLGTTLLTGFALAFARALGEYGSVIFIAGVLVVYRQITYINSRDLGYSRENVIHFEIPFSIDSAKMAASSAFVQELRQIPGVANAAS